MKWTMFKITNAMICENMFVNIYVLASKVFESPFVKSNITNFKENRNAFDLEKSTDVFIMDTFVDLLS